MSVSFSSQQGKPIHVALEPVFNTLNSFSLLTATEHLPGLNMWVVQTAKTLSPERLHANRLVFEGLQNVLEPEQDVPDFPTYLKQLAEQDPYMLRGRVFKYLYASASYYDGPSVEPDLTRLLNDVQVYLSYMEYSRGNAPFDSVLQTEVHALLNDPPTLHHLIVSHLEELWKMTFATEWRRVQFFLRWQVEMFTRSLDEEVTIGEAFYVCTGRELPSNITPEQFIDSSKIILVPSWHMGRHVRLWKSGKTIRLFFSEPPNYDVNILRNAPVGRGELRARLDALADETRLRIVELLVQQDEMSAQDIIAALNLGQSSVSRHLKQLVSMGYLYERRGEGANKTYRLSTFYFERTAHALKQLVSGEDSRTEPLIKTHDETLPKELRRFLDSSGRVAMWPPSKQRDKLLILEYLTSFFEQGQVYSEKEVNSLLLLHSVVRDGVALRRALYDYRFVNRTRDGSQYWRIGSEALEKDVGD